MEMEACVGDWGTSFVELSLLVTRCSLFMDSRLNGAVVGDH